MSFGISGLVAGLPQTPVSLTQLHAPPPMLPSAEHDFYARLRIPKASDSVTIHHAFRKLVLELHPDRNPSNSADVFTKLCEAYEVLSNPLTRGVYDLFGKEGLEMGIPSVEGQPEFKGYVYHGNPQLTFKSFFGSDNVFHEIFKSRLYQEGTGVQSMGFTALNPPPIHSPPIHLEVCVTLIELYHGTTKLIPWTRKVHQQPWKGNLKVCIDPGTEPNTQYVFPKYGDEAPNSIPSDVVVHLKFQPHPRFQLTVDHELKYLHKVSLEQALVGFTLSIPTLDGRTLAITVPEIVSPGYVKRISGEGFPKLQSDGSITHGDLIIEFQIVFPNYLSLKQKEWIQKGLSSEKGKLLTSTHNSKPKPTLQI
ncbi:DnaJ sub B member 13 [Coelomomyces lativittatus]|nr:DnaJ sub B member 13 [Coelomomyces lativittatus]KAJ1512167.1 DnaJ sub B member 13 [Coelomomyces lativittatus]KAJ1516041.1 DnaJ sub B member 13 [Coelomomyces lativittatus]